MGELYLEHTGFTSLGTSTTKTELGGADITLPSDAKWLYAVIPQVAIDVPTAAESVIASLSLESDDFPVQPFEVLAQPIGAILGATNSGIIPKQPRWAVGCPVKGGGKLRVYGTALVANTAAPTMGCSLVLGDSPPGHARKRAKLGAITSTGTTASSDVAEAAYTFTDGRRITEVFGVLGHTTVAAASAVMGYIKYQSSEFVNSRPLKLPLEPIGGGLSTLIQTVPQLSRAPVNMGIKTPTTISAYLYMGLAPTVAGNFASGAVFE